MDQVRTRRWQALLFFALLAAAVLIGIGAAAQVDADSVLQEVPVGGKIETENACYVRLPDLPRTRYNLGGHYGGFGAYNPETGVLAFAGGAEKRTTLNTIASYELFAIKLDGTMDTWNVVPYPHTVGYTRDFDKGCREQTSVMITSTLWASVGGKDGCDNGNVDSGKKGGDIKVLTVGDTADTIGVRWENQSGVVAGSLPPLLASNKMKLIKNFAAYDTKRERIVFGQGAFDDRYDSTTRSEVYQAKRVGHGWSVTQLRPSGTVPYKRFSSCAAYVGDEAAGLDGIIVLGGQEGGVHGKSLKEVWWLDFSSGSNGEWTEITDRFANMDDLGYRRGGACAYDAETKKFYSWMGRADETVPDGAKRSAGFWRTDLSQLADETAPLTWERLAKDLQADVEGRRLIPSVWDPVNKRFFVIGGRNGNDEWSDTWAIYPDVTGQACTDLDPYAPFAKPAVPTPTPRPTEDPTQPPQPMECPQLEGKAPPQVIADALANPSTVAGWLKPVNPNMPAGPANPLKHWLSLGNLGVPWHPVYNDVEYKAGCP
ncbi:MAG: hypothetical protein ACK2T6_01570 [Anaerolineae bacterium]